MNQYSHPKPVRHYDTSSIERVRVLAAVLLVAFHVIGLPSSGLQVDYPNPLRIFADIVADFRMPAFALIAGFVYALRPVHLKDINRFFIRKMKRLAVPGIIAVIAFYTISEVMNLHWSDDQPQPWMVIFFPYAHFWFLQAILVILFTIGLIDAATNGRSEYLLPFAIILSVAHLPITDLFSLNEAVRLAPFFLAGICYWRRKAWIEHHAQALTAVAILAIVLWGAWTVVDYQATRIIEIGHRQVQAILFGISSFTLLLFYPLPLPGSRTVGQYTFTIYLYHVLATSGMRRLLLHFGVDSLAVHLIFGIAAGLLVPAALHRLLLSWPLASKLVLGIRHSATPAVAAPAVTAPASGSTAKPLPPIAIQAKLDARHR